MEGHGVESSPRKYCGARVGSLNWTVWSSTFVIWSTLVTFASARKKYATNFALNHFCAEKITSSAVSVLPNGLFAFRRRLKRHVRWSADDSQLSASIAVTWNGP